ncbi:MAG: hypothetical protein NTW75_13240 [Planctomycetales bacterium]|jgi:hypothetical protein|nr:hypothetical protein [Planctomycetales bacterium]
MADHGTFVHTGFGSVLLWGIVSAYPVWTQADDTALRTTAGVQQAESVVPVVTVVIGGELNLTPEDCRVRIVGPRWKQPDLYPSSGGFLG